jgi:hypothetical protein
VRPIRAGERQTELAKRALRTEDHDVSVVWIVRKVDQKRIPSLREPVSSGSALAATHDEKLSRLLSSVEMAGAVMA